ncbi:uncharacterized protein KY384_003207 [Bacidia gigantensis]|uniref:uncharacterized protein n=1 Tax=Bacidia gigantensis TaxID=2732470 RepID=UPI001D0522F1|nr:uncharacterized protein KY384_003207 [Bacidia gigantensis]KAG8531577.1 hypothetical protein KY384_003207 [Bacidia gigantensis]
MGGSVPTIPGNKADHSLASGFRYEVAGLLGRKQTTFPGAQPVSFAAKHLTELQSQDYYVCEKTDGIRCLMYLTHDGPQEVVYLIDRKNDYYHVPGLHFPVKGSETEFHKNTIVDGELVNDTLPDGTVQMKYLVFDCMVLDGKVLMHRTLDKRLAYFRENVFFPYEGLYKKYPGEEEFLPFILKFKQMELGYAIEKMFTEVLPNLQHGNDGLIFTCRNSPYTPGTDERILKWKTKSENSIDFRMHFRFPMVEPDSDDEDEEGAYPDYTAMPQVYLTVFGGDNADDKFMGDLSLSQEEWEAMKEPNEPLGERIVECTLDQDHKWRFLRFRDDKKESNHVSVAEKVIESIQDAVSREDLVRQQGRIRDEWKKRQQAAAEEQARQEQDVRRSAAAAAQKGGKWTTGRFSDGQWSR